ncbi:MAG: periplasmic heavy metal sensor [Alphaproteobacteria bacterium]|nr:periplasmic heavy metal sensor [Alphaproteobacteria bacterium]
MTKYIKIIFTFSVILNIALIGVVVGGAYKKHQWRQGKFQHNPELVQIMRNNIEKNQEGFRKKIKDMKQKREVLKSIIESEKFDREAYDHQISKILENKNEMAEMKAKAMGETLSTLSLEERKKFSNFILRGVSGHGRGPRSSHDIKH